MSRTMNKEVVKQVTKLLATAAFALGGMYFTLKWMEAIMHPKPATNRALLRKLKTSAGALALNEYEANVAQRCHMPEDIDVRMCDVAGMEAVINKLKEDVFLAQHCAGQPGSSLLSSSRGLLLYGPPGAGKTMMAKAFAAEVGAILLNITASALLSKWMGDSNRLTRAIFTLARKIAHHGHTTIVFVDEVDALLGEGGEGENGTYTQVRSEFIQMWDGLNRVMDVIVVGATNRPNHLTDAVWRRFCCHFEVPLPSEAVRCEILHKKLHTMQTELSGLLSCKPASCVAPDWFSLETKTVVSPGSDGVPTTAALATAVKQSQTTVEAILCVDRHPLERSAALTAGFSGADLVEVCRRAARHYAAKALVERERRLIADLRQREEQGADTQQTPTPMTEAALLQAICEVQAASITPRGNYLQLPKSTSAAAAGDTASGAQITSLTLLLSMLDPTALRALAALKEQGGEGGES